MIALLPPLAAVALAWAIVRLAPRDALPLLPGALLLAPLAAGLWPLALALAGVRWSLVPLALPLAVVPLSLVLRRPRLPARRSPWALAAGAVALVHAGVIAAVPAFGWDFRYIWGLKARVFAAAGGVDSAWLGWPGHGFAHPTYPPLWSAVLGAGLAPGPPIAEVAAAWGALAVLALAATCWWAARDAPVPVRALAAAVGAWAPAIFWPRYSGFADPLLAVFAAAALGALVRLGRRADGALPMLALAAAGLALTKQEGMALAAAALIAAATVTGLRRIGPAALPAVALTAAWWAFLAVHRIGMGEYRPALAAVARHAVELPAALAASLRPGEAAVLAAWLLLAAGLRHRALGLALALWFAGVLAAYLATRADLAWHIANSLDRVLAAPLPGALAAALAAAWRPGPPGASDVVSRPGLRLDRRAPRL